MAPEGAHVGKPMVLAEFQKAFLRAVYGSQATLAWLALLLKHGIFQTHILAPFPYRHKKSTRHFC